MMAMSADDNNSEGDDEGNYRRCLLDEEKSNCWRMRVSRQLKLSKADLMPVDKPWAPTPSPLTDKKKNWGEDKRENNSDEKERIEEEITKTKSFEEEIKKKTTETQTRWEAEPLSRTPLWKPPLGPKILPSDPIPHKSSVYETILARRPNLHPPPHSRPPFPSLETTFPKSLDAGGKGLHTPLRLSCDYLAGAAPYQTSAS